MKINYKLNTMNVLKFISFDLITDKYKIKL